MNVFLSAVTGLTVGCGLVGSIIGIFVMKQTTSLRDLSFSDSGVIQMMTLAAAATLFLVIGIIGAYKVARQLGAMTEEKTLDDDPSDHSLLGRD